MHYSGRNKSVIWLIPLLFLLYSAPGALGYVFHFPDEKYYTDAALQMMDKGDYFTPYKADGTYRFLKPIVTYWVLIGSYKSFGVSVLSSRIFFWLAGAALVIVTFLMANSLTGNRKLSAVAAFVTAANPLVLMSASRSIPDILLVLFLTVSAWGFLEIMIAQQPDKKYYWFAYLGAALAFETKGIPAAAFAGVSMLFLVLNPWKRKKIAELFEPVSLAVSVLVALSWFLIMYFQHGTEYLSSFYNDQVGERVSSRGLQAVKNALLGIGNLIAFLVPWIFIAFSRPAKLSAFFKQTNVKTKAISGFIVTWIVLTILMSGAVFKFYDRYLLPVIPLVSILFAMVFIFSETRWKSLFFHLFLILNLFVFAVNIWYAIFILPDTVLVSGIIFTAIILALYFFRLKNVSVEILLANAVMLLYMNVFALLYPLLMPNPGEQLVNHLKAEGIQKNEKVYVYGNIRAASNIRIHSHHQLNVVSMDTVYRLPKEPGHFLVFSKKEQPLLNLQNYSVSEGSEEWLRVPVEKFPAFLQQPVQNLKESGTTYFIAKPITQK